MYGYEKLEVWREAFELTYQIHKLTEQFPKQDMYTYTAQMRRSALSIPSNIAEGKGRLSDNELRRFCLIAYGSAMELQTQLLLVKRLKYATERSFIPVEERLLSVLRLLNAFIRKIPKKSQQPAADSQQPISP